MMPTRKKLMPRMVLKTLSMVCVIQSLIQSSRANFQQKTKHHWKALLMMQLSGSTLTQMPKFQNTNQRKKNWKERSTQFLLSFREQQEACQACQVVCQEVCQVVCQVVCQEVCQAVCQEACQVALLPQLRMMDQVLKKSISGTAARNINWLI